MDTPLRLAWYGDDFTGSADTLATLAAAGWRARLFLAPPTPEQRDRSGPLDALGVAGTARALDPAAMQAQIAPVAEAFAALRPAVTQYKCCSTFDSAPATGNLAAGLQALRRPLHDPVAWVLGGQPSLGRICVAGTLFASAGAGGELHRLDRHPTMSRHPVTPMAEADLRRHLAALGLAPCGLLDLRTLDEHDDAVLDATLAARLAESPEALLFDVARTAHLARIGRRLAARAAGRPQLVLGPSSVAQALLAAEGATTVPPPGPAVPPAEGPVFVLAGSLSPVTAAQRAEARGAYDTLVLDPAAGEAWHGVADAAVARLRGGRSVLVETVPPVDGGPPPLTVAALGGRLLAAVLRAAPGVRRAGVAGGDSSGLAVQALAPWALDAAGTLAPGVPLLRLVHDEPAFDGLELMLKGGQMGPSDVFLRLQRGSGSS